MRPIKFRGKRIDNGEWIYGYYCVIEHKHYIVPDDAQIWTLPDYDEKGIVGFVKVIPETVGQFTGLKDNGKGKEVYAGDIITYQRKVLLMKWTATVIWDEKCFRWGLQDRDDGRISPLFVLQGYHWEVIGNIHEKPELLEAKEREVER